MARQHLGLVFGEVGELALKDFDDARVKSTSSFAKQRAVGRVLNQRVLEQITSVRRCPAGTASPAETRRSSAAFDFGFQLVRDCG